uniref:Cilia- and flagella-associated protein 157 n=1 Tax=Myripristis murdjan TaxID=586833 RepID=A0A667YZ73_9TELE
RVMTKLWKVIEKSWNFFFFFRAAIWDLMCLSCRYQHKCDELEVQRRDFDSRYDTLQRDKRDVVEYLKRSVAQKEDELDELSERLQALQSATRQERESLQLQLSQAGQQLQDRTDQLSAENMKLAGKLADLEEFREQKERLLSELASLEKQLANQKEEHSAAVLSLERNALLENDRLKKEMHSHVAAMAAELRDMTEKRMPQTTVRAIRENAAVRSRLSQLSEQIHVLLQENEALRGRERQLRLDVSVLEPLLDQLTAKSRSHQKVAEQLTEKCQQLQAELAKDRSSAQQERQQLQTERTTLRDHAAALEESRGNGAEADRRGAELQEERRKRSRLERTVQEAAFALNQALTVKPHKSVLQSVQRQRGPSLTLIN